MHIKVIDRSMPVFKKQFYSETVPENVELHSPLSVSIEAESPLNRKLIYSIVRGNELEEFALDFNTGKSSDFLLLKLLVLFILKTNSRLVSETRSFKTELEHRTVKEFLEYLNTSNRTQKGTSVP